MIVLLFALIWRSSISDMMHLPWFFLISDPSFGIGCLGKVNAVYENDKDLMIKFYQFVAK